MEKAAEGADITFVMTLAGFLYLAVVLDAWSRRIVGRSMTNDLRTELELKVSEMALGQRRPANVVHHSISRCGFQLVTLLCRAEDHVQERLRMLRSRTVLTS